MSARVKHFLSALLHALKEERHFALLDGVAFPNRRLARNRFQARTQSDPCISSVTTSIMIITSNSLSLSEEQDYSINYSVFCCTPSRFPGCPACEPNFFICS